MQVMDKISTSLNKIKMKKLSIAPTYALRLMHYTQPTNQYPYCHFLT
ncbi:hypothetical protein HMPREF1991_01281 [Hoylesella loescheii DSM 19665 = JCM 12249 = ATCC 15930]|uniref:Uncharacterized protein n=1 Tax=Hoylesella loescheii DSM 19665 = JCM 12249 = ATCC 15930 TaxID=1122985 RepID=A0A069QS06_HOYLO|nr:hypothetical protein HMPREF1991_01281 [Hoylesella loescheii DSM 19665 = JCM 12249 = ATCC 15930]